MIWGFPEQNKDFIIQNMGEYHFVSIAHRMSSLTLWRFSILHQRENIYVDSNSTNKNETH